MSESPKHPIWYEPHPVEAERKAAIRAAGFVILDAVFKPEGHENPEVPGLSLTPATGEAPSDPVDLTAAQIKEQLSAKGIPFRGNAPKADLLALLSAPPAGDSQGESTATGEAPSE